MKFTQAIELLLPFCNTTPSPVCVVHNEDGTITAQLPTGLADQPFIAINDDLVVENELLEVLDNHTNPAPREADSFPFESGEIESGQECDDLFAFSKAA